MTLKRTDNILYFDIETSHCGALIWGGGKQYVAYDDIHKERKVLCIGWMWEGEKEVYTDHMDMKLHNGWDLRVYDDEADKEMLKRFSKVLEKASLIVAHNGRRFDIERIRARLVKYKLPDLPPVKLDDSYQLCKGISFTFHKLDYLGKYLGEGKKIHTTKHLWQQIMIGDTLEIRKKYLDKMVKYMRQDVILLAKIYKRLRPYAKSNLNLAVSRNVTHSCPSCGSKHLQKRGYYTTGTAKYQRYVCVGCGKFSSDGKNEVKSISNFLRSR